MQALEISTTLPSEVEVAFRSDVHLTPRLRVARGMANDTFRLHFHARSDCNPIFGAPRALPHDY